MAHHLPPVLVTRPALSAVRFLDALRQAAGQPVHGVISPVLGISYLPVTRPETPFSGLILTSEHGAIAAGRLGLPSGLRAWTVGDRTAAVAAELGFQPVSAGGDADDLAALILGAGESGPLLQVRGEKGRDDLAFALEASGINITVLVAYRQDRLTLTAEARNLLAGTEPVVVPGFSPESVSALADQGPFAAPLHVVAISAAAAARATALHPIRLLQAARPNAQAMVEATLAAMRLAAAP